MRFLALFAFLPAALFNFYTPYAPQFDVALKGIYLTAQTIARPQGMELAEVFKKAGGNMVVIDVQTGGGRLAYPSNIPLSIELDNRSTTISDLPTLVENLKDKDFYVVARYVLLKNTFLAKKRPQWTLKRRGTNRTFVSRDGPIWLDPTNPELKEYVIAISRELADAGVDEVQFDYVRFPEGSGGGYVGYSYRDEEYFSRDEAITSLVADLANTLHLSGADISVDVFGIVVWENISWKIIGQNIRDLAYFVDAIYPMPYPSHFGPGWGGHRNPGDEPYFFVQETTKKFLEQTKDGRAEIRPWLQGFAWRASRFGSDYIKTQITALADIGINDFSVWNASNNYSATFKAL